MKLLLDLQGAQTESRFRGIGRQTRSLARAILADRGNHDVHLLLNAALVDGLDDLITEFTPLLEKGRLHVFNAGTGVAQRDLNNLWRTKAAELIREAYIAGLKPDVLHMGSLFEGFVDDAVTSIGSFDVPYKTAVTLHDLIPLINPKQYLGEERHRLYYLRRVQALKRADRLLSVSESSRREAVTYARIPADRISVIGCGVEAAFHPLDLTATDKALLRARYGIERPFLLYAGAVDPRKNVELIFQAFGRLPQALRAGHDLVFVGRLFDDEKGQLRTAAARSGIPSASLVFCDHVSEADLVALYSICEAFLFPSRHEGFGLPALEAMACGAPVLAADATSIPEVVGRPDFLFDPDDDARFAHLLEKVLTEPSVGEELRSWGLRRASELTWARSGRAALSAMEALHEEGRAVGGSGWTPTGSDHSPVVPLKKKPMMAFFSPLPSDRSGIADYSAELLPELARFYEIECIVLDTVVTDDWVLANYTVRDVGWFERNAHLYDRVVYSIGNSHFHRHMLGLMQRFPGIVILHDFFLSDLIDWMSNTGQLPYDEFFRELYRTHGLGALSVERQSGRLVAVDRFACNSIVFRNATGIIVHSQYAMDRAAELYGPSVLGRMYRIPHLRAPYHGLDRAAARRRLGISEQEFVVCSFGILTKRKLSRKVLDAWISAYAGSRAKVRLIFVGDNAAGAYGDQLMAEIRRHEKDLRIVVTGYASTASYRDHLAAADLAVQLRTESRGETSGTVLDCLAAGVPVIVNDHGSSGEFPETAVVKLPDDFEISELATAIERFRADPAACAEQGRLGRDHIVEHHEPHRVGERFHDVIEEIGTTTTGAIEETLLAAISDFNAPVPPNEFDFLSVARSVGQNRGRIGPRQILFDVTVLAEQDAKTGIQRVVRSMLAQLIANPPPGHVVEPVQIEDHFFRYARRFTAHAYDIPAAVLPNAPVEFDAGDIYLAIDWVPDRLPSVEGWLERFRRAGGRVVIGVHDLLPLQLPHYFPPFMEAVMRRWFETGLRVADRFVCVSKVVADDVVRLGEALQNGKRRASIEVGYFHNGCDLEASMPSKGLPKNHAEVLQAMRSRRTFLMVGTVEPRKGHSQVLDAMDALWKSGEDVGLVIVGKEGWMVDEVATRIANHAEFGVRLFWLNGISDEFLDLVYANASALIAASMGEGFGLPLIEAARHGASLIARDIPVFREVAGEHAFFFAAVDGEGLAAELREWLALPPDEVPKSVGMRYLTWEESTAEMLDTVFGRRPYEVLELGKTERR